MRELRWLLLAAAAVCLLFLALPWLVGFLPHTTRSWDHRLFVCSECGLMKTVETTERDGVILTRSQKTKQTGVSAVFSRVEGPPTTHTWHKVYSGGHSWLRPLDLPFLGGARQFSSGGALSKYELESLSNDQQFLDELYEVATSDGALAHEIWWTICQVLTDRKYSESEAHLCLMRWLQRKEDRPPLHTWFLESRQALQMQ